MSFAVVSASFSSFSLKFDFRSQPMVVVISLIGSKQDSGGTLPLKMSNQMYIISAKKSRRLMCALEKR